MAVNPLDFNEYILGGLDLRSLGFIPGHVSRSHNIGLTGHLDLPARTGKTHHVWPEKKNVEAYVRPEEIVYAGRDIVLHGYVWGDLRTDLYDKIEALNQAMDAFEGEQELSCKWGSFLVTVKNFTVERIKDGKAEIKITFREGKPNLEGVLPSSQSGGYGIDGYSWEDLGVIKMKTSGELNRGESKKLEVSVYGYEKNRVKYHDAIDISLSFFVRKPTYEELATTIQNFAYVIGRPYRRILALEDGSFRECFAKDGFQVKDILIQNGECVAFIDLRLTEIRRYKEYNIAGNEEGYILGDITGEGFLIVP